MSEQATVVADAGSTASATDVLSAFAQEVTLWQQIDEELSLFDRSRRKLAQLFTELKPLVLARGGKRTKGEQNQQSWAKSIIERGLTVRTVDDWIARQAAGWPKRWPIKPVGEGEEAVSSAVSIEQTDSTEDTATTEQADSQLADSADCSTTEPATQNTEVHADTCECVFRLALTVEEKAQLLSALDRLIGFSGSTNRVEALYKAVLYAANMISAVAGASGNSAQLINASSISSEAAEVIQ